MTSHVSAKVHKKQMPGLPLLRRGIEGEVKIKQI